MAVNTYAFFIGNCLLPVPPEKLQVKINNANKTVTLINEGPVNILKTPGLTDIELECLIPQVKYPFASYPSSGFRPGKYYLDHFEKLKVDKKPFQFIVSRVLPGDLTPLFSTNIKVSLEEYEIVEDAADGFDLRVKIRLKQYRDYGTKTVTVKLKEPAASIKKERPANPPIKKEFKTGDIVYFKGGTHYYSSYAGAKGYAARAGKARITLDKNCKGNGGAHPYHLVHTDASSNVYGWVDVGTFEFI